ncbi:MAG: hypothetical protein KTR27_18015 [Leptolyngbyaceae cyanobacterium MAG.088]|nr:hypothetical protein [Leptolyngbyaceae cyanobacterium MAG.088]
MGTRQKIRCYQRWITIACLGSLGWLGLSVPELFAQPSSAQTPTTSSQLCTDETGFYWRNRVTTHAHWSQQALNKGYLQPAADHLAKALELTGTIEDGDTKAQILEEFVAEYNAVAGWLLHGVDRLVALGDTDAAKTVLLSARDAAQDLPVGYSALKIKMLTTIAVDYAAIEDTASALALLSQARVIVDANIQEAEFKVNALIAIAQGYNELSVYELAMEVATQALQQVEVVDYRDSVRRDRAVAEIATIYAQVGELDRALTLAQSIEQPYYRENTIADVALSAAQSGKRVRAADLVQQLTLDQPTIRALQDIGLYLASSGYQTEARFYFNQVIAAIEKHGYPGPSFTRTMVKAGFAEIVLDALTTAPKGRITVDGLMDMASHYASVNNNAAASDVLQQALIAVAYVEQTYAQKELWEDILKHALKLEDYDLALLTVETLVDKGHTFDEESNYATIAVAAARSGQIDIALKVTERIDPSYRTYTHRAWRAIAVAYAIAGDFDAAFTMAEKTRSSAEAYARALVHIGLQQRQFGQLDESAKTIERSIQVAEDLADSSIHLHLEALNVITLAHFQAGQPDTKLFGQVLSMVREVASDSYESFTLQTVVSGWVEAGEYELALQLFDVIAQVNPENPLWKNLLIERLIREEGYEAALDIIESRDVSHIEVDEMLKIAERFLEIGQQDQALRLLTYAYSAPDSDTRQLLRVAELYGQLDQTAQVLPVLARAFEVAQTVPGEESQMLYIKEDLVVEDNNDRGSLYGDIAVAYGRVGEFDQGLAVVQALQDGDTRERAMDRLNCYRGF